MYVGRGGGGVGGTAESWVLAAYNNNKNTNNWITSRGPMPLPSPVPTALMFLPCDVEKIPHSISLTAISLFAPYMIR